MEYHLWWWQRRFWNRRYWCCHRWRNIRQWPSRWDCDESFLWIYVGPFRWLVGPSLQQYEHRCECYFRIAIFPASWHPQQWSPHLRKHSLTRQSRVSVLRSSPLTWSITLQVCITSPLLTRHWWRAFIRNLRLRYHWFVQIHWIYHLHQCQHCQRLLGVHRIRLCCRNWCFPLVQYWCHVCLNF